MKLFRIISALALVSTAAFAQGFNVEGYITNMDLYAQEQSEWCWAGITQTVSKVFGHYKPQCRMASRFIKNQEGDYCCQNNRGGTAECNQPYFLDKSLGFYGFLDGMYASQIQTLNIVQELKKRYPVGIRIGWDGGGGHFVIIYGAKYVGKTQTFNVWNPLPLGKGDKQIVNRQGLVRYNNAGNWTHSYTTKNG